MLLSRIEVDGQIDFSGATPSNVDVRIAVAKALDVDKELVVIKEIYTQYGQTKATVRAYQYISIDERNKLESKIVEQEKKAAEAAAKDEAAKKAKDEVAAPKAAEAPKVEPAKVDQPKGE